MKRLELDRQIDNAGDVVIRASDDGFMMLLLCSLILLVVKLLGIWDIPWGVVALPALLLPALFLLFWVAFIGLLIIAAVILAVLAVTVVFCTWFVFTLEQMFCSPKIRGGWDDDRPKY